MIELLCSVQILPPKTAPHGRNSSCMYLSRARLLGREQMEKIDMTCEMLTQMLDAGTVPHLRHLHSLLDHAAARDLATFEALRKIVSGLPIHLDLTQATSFVAINMHLRVSSPP